MWVQKEQHPLTPKGCSIVPLISSVTLLPPLYELLSLPQRLLWRQNHITCGNRTGAIWLLIPPSNFGPPHCFTDWTFLFTIITTNIVETLILNVIEFDYVLGKQIFLCKFGRVDLMIQVLVLEYKGILEFACSLQPSFFNEGAFSMCNEIVPTCKPKRRLLPGVNSAETLTLSVSKTMRLYASCENHPIMMFSCSSPSWQDTHLNV